VKILKHTIGILLAIGVYGPATPASAQFCVASGTNTVCNPRHSVFELHAANGGSGSFAATSVMGAEGFSNAAVPNDWENFITSGCTAKTKTLAAPPIGTGTLPLSVWPSTCNPDGMALFLNQFSPPNPPGEPLVHWITFKSTDQTTTLNEIIRGLRDFGSPGIVPIYGQADHWVAITQVTVSPTGVILNVRAFDGGVQNGTDSGFNSYFTGLQSWGTTAWKNTFFTVVTAINPSCDSVVPNGCGAPPVNDPFAYKYVLMYEPPASGTHAATSAPLSFAATPGIVAAGAMNERVAQVRMMDALIAGGIDSDAQMWNGIKGGTPGTAFRVSGVWPSGAAWDYYLVPILSSTNTNTVIGFAHLDAADGSFQGVNLLATPAPFTPVQMARAQEIASGVLARGERLKAGVLTWNPRTNSKFAKSPNAPYYEFGIAGAGKTAAVRVRLNDGLVERTN
jgi:hypothetical protein